LKAIEDAKKEVELLKTITSKMDKNTDHLEKRISDMQRKELKQIVL